MIWQDALLMLLPNKTGPTAFPHLEGNQSVLLSSRSNGLLVTLQLLVLLNTLPLSSHYLQPCPPLHPGWTHAKNKDSFLFPPKATLSRSFSFPHWGSDFAWGFAGLVRQPGRCPSSKSGSSSPQPPTRTLHWQCPREQLPPHILMALLPRSLCPSKLESEGGPLSPFFVSASPCLQWSENNQTPLSRVWCLTPVSAGSHSPHLSWPCVSLLTTHLNETQTST